MALINEVRNGLARLCIYRNILQDEVIDSLVKTLDCFSGQGPSLDVINNYHDFVFKLYHTDRSFQEHLLYLILHDENPFSRATEIKDFEDINPALIKAVKHDLAMLFKVYKIDFNYLAKAMEISSPLLNMAGPVFKTGNDNGNAIIKVLASSRDWPALAEQLADYYAVNSCGIFPLYRAFRWDKEKGLVGIDQPDMPAMDDLLGYDTQKQQVCKNTEQFLAGHTANNILLYGSRGTGKSTMVKALLPKYYDHKLRIVEVGRDSLDQLSNIVGQLRHSSLKFILFIDDLSFEDYETEYKDLKAVLEGSLEARPANVLIYATSNRRHLVKEYFSDRGQAADEIHTGDSMQEKLSLADRFGLTITFPSPGQQTYLQIVEHLVSKKKLDIDPELLRRRALEWERSHHGPSGRTARQFVDSLGGCFI